AAHVGQGAVAVPLHLVAPVLPLRQLRGERGEHRAVWPTASRIIELLGVTPPDQEPVLLLAVEVRRHERPDALQALPGETHRQLAVPLLLDELIGAVVPDLDRAGAVLPRRDLTGEGGVFERVILDVDRERAASRLERHPLRDGPGGEGAVPLQPEVVVEPAGVVPLDDEDRPGAAAPAAEGLRGLAGISLTTVGVELGHLFHRFAVFNAPAAGHNAPELLHLTGGRRPGPASGGPRRIYPLVEKPVDAVETRATPRKSGVDPHLSELAAPAAAPLIRAEPAEFVERPDESVAQVPRRLIRILLGPASRFGDDRVDHPEL